jgi:hypothetical protein
MRFAPSDLCDATRKVNVSPSGFALCYSLTNLMEGNMFNVTIFDVFGWLWNALICALMFDQGRRYERRRAKELRESVLDQVRLVELERNGGTREPTLGDWKF